MTAGVISLIFNLAWWGFMHGCDGGRPVGAPWRQRKVDRRWLFTPPFAVSIVLLINLFLVSCLALGGKSLYYNGYSRTDVLCVLEERTENVDRD